MKFEYSPKLRLKARDTGLCVNCNNRIHKLDLQLGRIFCEECMIKADEEAIKLNVCSLCALCGLKREKLKGYGACKEDLMQINTDLKKCKKYRRRAEISLEIEKLKEEYNSLELM